MKYLVLFLMIFADQILLRSFPEKMKLFVVDCYKKKHKNLYQAFFEKFSNKETQGQKITSFFHYLLITKNIPCFSFCEETGEDQEKIVKNFFYSPRIEISDSCCFDIFSCASLYCSLPGCDSYLILKKGPKFFLWNQTKKKVASQQSIIENEMILNDNSDKVKFSWILFLQEGLIEIYSSIQKQSFFYEVEIPVSWDEYINFELFRRHGSYNMNKKKLFDAEGGEYLPS